MRGAQQAGRRDRGALRAVQVRLRPPACLPACVALLSSFRRVEWLVSPLTLRSLSPLSSDPSMRDPFPCRGTQTRPELGTQGVVCVHCSEADPVMEHAERGLFGRQFEQAIPGRHLKVADVGAGRTNPSSAEARFACLTCLSRVDPRHSPEGFRAHPCLFFECTVADTALTHRITCLPC